MKKVNLILILLLLFGYESSRVIAQNVTIKVDATQNKRLISPSIYGKNEWFDKPVQFYKDAGLRFARENGGNNASAYNWRLKLGVHPDWYNNVYLDNWDAAAQNLSSNLPGVQGMFAFQLLGRVASSNQHNFDDWGYNQSQYWSGVGQNLAGGGKPNPAGGSKALVDGDINLFSKPWPADSSVAILDHWFGANGLGLNKDQFQYWSMDNEVDVWNGTHDWAMPTLISASAFMDRYIELAKKAKALYPGIKLCGPVTTSEWQWFKWSNESIWINGRYYPWIEYFIKRLGDEYKATGVKLVDVIDIHNYPFYNNDAEALQGHRIYYDTNYNYPGANGVYTSTGGWNTSLKQEYIFKRFNDWLNEEFGPNHGITLGVSEWSPGPSNPNYAAVIYASHLGTFANNGVEVFSPWSWMTGMWETLHLFSRYGKEFSIQSTSTLEDSVSAYSSINANSDSMTIFLVNRSIKNQQSVKVKVDNMPIYGDYTTLALYNLPSTETFKSHASNALKTGSVSVFDSVFTATLPALSVTAVILKKNVQPITIRSSKSPVCIGDSSVTYNIPYKQGVHYKWTYSGKGVSIENDTLSTIKVNYSDTAQSGTLTAEALYPADSTWTFDVTVYTPPTPPTDVGAGKNPVCQSDNNITYSVTKDSTLTYKWNYSGTGATITNGTSNAISINYGGSATSGNLTVTATNAGGCNASKDFAVTINAQPTQPGVISAGKNPVCIGDSAISFSVTKNPAVSYQWAYSGSGDTIIGDTTNAVLMSFNEIATSGTLKVTASNENCSISRTLAITVNTPPAQPSIITAGKNPVCQGTSNIAYSVTNTSGITYAWTYSGTGATITNGTKNAISVNYSNTATSGTLKVTVANGTGCVDTSTNYRKYNVTINDLPAQPTAITASKNPVIQGDTSITFSVTNDPLVNYGWTYSGTGATISNGTSNAISVDFSNTATSGTLTVTATNNNSCALTNSLGITLKPSAVNTINTADKDVFMVSQTYGNPELICSYSIAKGSQVVIDLVDIQGRLVISIENTYKQAGTYSIQFNHSGLPKGVYVVRFKAGNTLRQKKLLLMD